jgi:hypothetical protein
MGGVLLLSRKGRRRTVFGAVCVVMNLLDLVWLSPQMALTSGRSEIRVGIVDGPADLSHPSLAGARIVEIGPSSSACRKQSSAGCVHGTFVVGMLAARREYLATSICPGCTFLIRSIFPESYDERAFWTKGRQCAWSRRNKSRRWRKDTENGRNQRCSSFRYGSNRATVVQIAQCKCRRFEAGCDRCLGSQTSKPRPPPPKCVGCAPQFDARSPNRDQRRLTGEIRDD